MHLFIVCIFTILPFFGEARVTYASNIIRDSALALNSELVASGLLDTLYQPSVYDPLAPYVPSVVSPVADVVAPVEDPILPVVVGAGNVPVSFPAVYYSSHKHPHHKWRRNQVLLDSGAYRLV